MDAGGDALHARQQGQLSIYDALDPDHLADSAPPPGSGEIGSSAAAQAICIRCGEGFTAATWDDRHSDGEYELHATCCTPCPDETTPPPRELHEPADERSAQAGADAGRQALEPLIARAVYNRLGRAEHTAWSVHATLSDPAILERNGTARRVAIVYVGGLGELDPEGRREATARAVEAAWLAAGPDYQARTADDPEADDTPSDKPRRIRPHIQVDNPVKEADDGPHDWRYIGRRWPDATDTDTSPEIYIERRWNGRVAPPISRQFKGEIRSGIRIAAGGAKLDRQAVIIQPAQDGGERPVPRVEVSGPYTWPSLPGRWRFDAKVIVASTREGTDIAPWLVYATREVEGEGPTNAEAHAIIVDLAAGAWTAAGNSLDTVPPLVNTDALISSDE